MCCALQCHKRHVFMPIISVVRFWLYIFFIYFFFFSLCFLYGCASGIPEKWIEFKNWYLFVYKIMRVFKISSIKRFGIDINIDIDVIEIEWNGMKKKKNHRTTELNTLIAFLLRLTFRFSFQMHFPYSYPKNPKMHWSLVAEVRVQAIRLQTNEIQKKKKKRKKCANRIPNSI